MRTENLLLIIEAPFFTDATCAAKGGGESKARGEGGPGSRSNVGAQIHGIGPSTSAGQPATGLLL